MNMPPRLSADALSPRPRPRVVVIGAGFGGLSAARHLAGTPVDVTVINRDNYHGFWPLLYQVATAGLGPDDIARPVRAVLSSQRNAHFLLGTVTGVDLERRTVHVEGEADVPYDYLIVAAGSVAADFDIPGVQENTFPLKTLPDAVRLRNHVLVSFEEADAGAADVADGVLTFVLIGGGATGVELAGALSELISTNLAADFPNLDVGRARVVIVEMASQLLPGFSRASHEEALHALRSRGIEIRLETAVSSVSPRPNGPGTSHVVTLSDGSTISAGTVVWTAGVRANDLGRLFSSERGKGGTVQVGPDLSLPGHPEVFCIGDVAAAAGRRRRRAGGEPGGEQLPQLAQVAIQGGRHAARTIARRLRGRPGRPFRYHNHGIMATIGRRAAVAELPGGVRLDGTLGWLAWLGVHLVFLIGFRNRLVVLANWTWNYLTWDRASRVILDVSDCTAGPGLDQPARPTAPSASATASSSTRD